MNRYRTKVPMLALVIMLFIQLTYLVTASGTVANLRRGVSTNDFNNQFDVIVEDMSRKLEDMVFVAQAIESVQSFSKRQIDDVMVTPLVEEVRQKKLFREIESTVDGLSLSPGVVERVIVISDDRKFMTYNKPIGMPGAVDKTLPTWRQLEKSGIAEYISQEKYGGIYFDSSESTLSGLLKESSKNYRQTLTDFCGLLDEHIVITNHSERSASHTLILMRTDMISETVKSTDVLVTLLNDNDKVIWTNDTLSNVYAIQQWPHGDGQWTTIYENVTYDNKSVVISPQNIRMVISRASQPYANAKNLQWTYLLLFIIMPCMSAALAYGAVRMMMHSLEQLTQDFSGQFGGEYHHIDEKKRHKWRNNIKFTQKMMMVFGVSVIIPAVITGVYYAVRLSRYTEDTNKEYIVNVSNSVVSKLSGIMDTCYLATSLMPKDELIAYLKDDEPSAEKRIALNEKITSQLTRGSYFSGFVLYNSFGQAIYDSMSPATGYMRVDGKFDIQAMLFLTDFYGARTDTFAVSDTSLNGPDNGAATALFRRLENSSSPPHVSRPYGYFGMYLNLLNFSEARPDSGYEFAVADEKGNILYKSDGARGNDDTIFTIVEKTRSTAEGQQRQLTVNGAEYTAMVTRLERTGWYIHSYVDMRMYREQSQLVLMTNLFVLAIVFFVILLFVWAMTSRLLKPIKTIEHELLMLAAGGGTKPVEYENKDEISQLVGAYNQMVDRIETLIEDNAYQRVRERDLLTMQMQVELRMLQQQINPHLLYNTLEFISYNAKREGCVTAGNMAVALAKLFRYTTSMKEETVRLSAEVEHVRNYINIHLMRFDYSFSVEYEVTPEAAECRVLKFILQPAVENSFKHGIHDKIVGARITVSAWIKDGMLHMLVSDNGIGMRPSKLAELRQTLAEEQQSPGLFDPLKETGNHAGDGIGMRNVYRRLIMYYGDKAAMHIRSEFMHGVTVEIVVPAMPF